MYVLVVETHKPNTQRVQAPVERKKTTQKAYLCIFVIPKHWVSVLRSELSPHLTFDSKVYESRFIIPSLEGLQKRPCQAPQS